MKIEYWSDYICPFCYIGKIRMERVIRELGLEKEVQLEMNSFELDPNTPLEVGFNAVEHFAYKYGLSMGSAKKRIDMISQAGKDEGIADMDYAGTRSTNTLDAHRLTKYAAQQGNTQIQKLLYHAFFCEHKNIGVRDVLLSIAQQAGLDKEEVLKVLESDCYTGEVRADEELAHKKNIHMVPHFIIDEKTEISGAGSEGEMKQSISELL